MEILKTYKLYIGGQFPRTESGRSYQIKSAAGQAIANACLGSKKDIRNAVQAARKAQTGWANKSGFNRSQIIYRIAEMLEARKVQFIDELMLMGQTEQSAVEEVRLSIDRLVYYAGWADKFQALSSSVNPVSSSHFNFSVPEPMGVVGVVACQKTALLGLISQTIPLLVGGNTVVVIANTLKALSAISHMDVNALSLADIDPNLLMAAQETAIDNLKRCTVYTEDFTSQTNQGLAYISAFQEIKTTWHPIEQLSGGGSGY